MSNVSEFREGTIIRSKLTGMAYVVTANYGGYAIAVRTQHVSNPDEWEIVAPRHQPAPPASG